MLSGPRKVNTRRAGCRIDTAKEANALLCGGLRSRFAGLVLHMLFRFFHGLRFLVGRLLRVSFCSRFFVMLFRSLGFLRGGGFMVFFVVHGFRWRLLRGGRGGSGIGGKRGPGQTHRGGNNQSGNFFHAEILKVVGVSPRRWGRDENYTRQAARLP